MTSVLIQIGCNSVDVEALCERSLTEFSLEASNGKISLAPWLSHEDQKQVLGFSIDEPSRKFASESSNDLEEESSTTSLLSNRDRMSWRETAEKRLFQIQTLLDRLTIGVETVTIREQLNHLANQYVLMAGHADQGDPKRMIRILGQIETSLKSIKDLSCK